MKRINQARKNRWAFLWNSPHPIPIGKALYSMALASGIIFFNTASLTHAQPNSNFGAVTIASSAEQVLEGYTGGSMSLSAIAPEDSQQRPCVGYADSTPDHVLILPNRLSRVTVAVNSNGGDTTLVIEGPGQTIYCGDDAGGSSDAVIQGRNWQDGEYKVWVGAFDAGVRYDYTLTVRQ